MEFKNQKEYEKYKELLEKYSIPGKVPAGMEWFEEAEEEWLAKQAAKKGDKGKANSMKINQSSAVTGDGSGYKGETLKVNPADLEFKGYNKVMSGKDIEDPGTKFAKKGNYKKTLDKIEGKFYDADGNLLIPKFDMPDRIKLSKEQKAANAALDSQFDENGFYKTEALKMPKKTRKREWRDKRFRQYQRAGDRLAKRMGIAPGIPSRLYDRSPDRGRKLLNDQKRRYSKSASTPTLTIPDYSLGGSAGQNMLKIGNKNLNTSGMKT